MLGAIAQRLFGTANERFIKKQQKTINLINSLEETIEKLSNEELKQQTEIFKKRLADGETLDDLLPEAFATVREAAKRTLGQRHYDVQLVGGIVLHKGMITEMKTGEGKTLVATLAAYLNALEGKGVHIVTVNDYLAQRDAEWMGQVYRFLGLTVDYIIHGKSSDERKDAYNADITYGTNNEIGFDYLRDNMRFSLDEMVMRDFNFAIIDEVDSILIDEARTPLIISGAAEDSSLTYIAVNKVIPMLDDKDYEKDEKQKSITLTEKGTTRVEELLKKEKIIKNGSLYDVANVNIVHHIDQALKAHKMFTCDVDYIIKDGKIVIIDEFTGRMMDGRRYSDGLHQAIEAKEGVKIQQENQTLAAVTFQNLFRMYPKLSGMTGTAMTEESEFAEIYNLEVTDIPTNKPIARIDYNDEIYRTAEEKYDAIIKTIIDCNKKGQPVLVGTTSIEKSEYIANLLKKNSKIKFEILNARHHEREASIVAQAGKPGAVTIATNMAGRGTDIQLGGNLDMRLKEELEGITDQNKIDKITAKIKEEIATGKEKVLASGGLYILGTERHESRRIDNQLRGRSGRQGDPGASKFYLSLDDDLMRIFGSDRMDTMLQRMGMPHGEPITHPWISKALEKAQEKVEARNFDIRKNLLKYDDVMNDQRKVIYSQRKELMQTDDISETIDDMRYDVVENIAYKSIPPKSMPENWDITSLKMELHHLTGIEFAVDDWAKEEGVSDDIIIDRIISQMDKIFKEKEETISPEIMRMLEKSMLLQVLDQLWKDHIATLEYMRHTILLRAYGQKDPLNEYKKEAFDLFREMLETLKERVVNLLSRVEVKLGDVEQLQQSSDLENIQEVHESPISALDSGKPTQEKSATFKYATKDEFNAKNPNTWGKVARNEPCPCGSGKKYKHCHGQL